MSADRGRCIQPVSHVLTMSARDLVAKALAEIQEERLNRAGGEAHYLQYLSDLSDAEEVLRELVSRIDSGMCKL